MTGKNDHRQGFSVMYAHELLHDRGAVILGSTTRWYQSRNIKIKCVVK